MLLPELVCLVFHPRSELLLGFEGPKGIPQLLEHRSRGAPSAGRQFVLCFLFFLVVVMGSVSVVMSEV